MALRKSEYLYHCTHISIYIDASFFLILLSTRISIELSPVTLIPFELLNLGVVEAGITSVKTSDSNNPSSSVATPFGQYSSLVHLLVDVSITEDRSVRSIVVDQVKKWLS